MSKVEVFNAKRIQSDPHYYFTVENFNVNTGLSGITLSYNEPDREGDKIHSYVTMDAAEGLEVGKAMVEMCQAMIDEDNTEE